MLPPCNKPCFPPFPPLCMLHPGRTSCPGTPPTPGTRTAWSTRRPWMGCSRPRPARVMAARTAALLATMPTPVHAPH